MADCGDLTCKFHHSTENVGPETCPRYKESTNVPDCAYDCAMDWTLSG